MLSSHRLLLGCYPDNITRTADGRLGEDTLCLIKIGHHPKISSQRRCAIQDLPWLYVYNLHTSQTIDPAHQDVRSSGLHTV